MRFKHYAIRTETTYREWIKRFIFFNGKRHPREMGPPEVERIAKAWPADAIRLDAHDAEAGAGRFYASCGWTEVGRAVYLGVPLIYYEILLA